MRAEMTMKANKQERAKLVMDVMTPHAQRAGKEAKRVIAEIWSEAYTLAEQGSNLLWHRFVYEAENQNSDYWYKRVQNGVLRRLKG
jgi:hypothetical protein